MVEERLKRDKRDAFNAAHPAGGLFTNLKRSAKKIAKRVKAADEKTTVPLAADAPSATGEPTTSENQ